MFGGQNGGGMMTQSMSSGGSSFFGGGTSTSTSTQTIIRNGERITRTTRTIVNPDGSMQTQTEEHRDALDGRSGGGGGGGFLNFH